LNELQEIVCGENEHLSGENDVFGGSRQKRLILSIKDYYF